MIKNVFRIDNSLIIYPIITPEFSVPGIFSWERDCLEGYGVVRLADNDDKVRLISFVNARSNFVIPQWIEDEDIKSEMFVMISFRVKKDDKVHGEPNFRIISPIKSANYYLNKNRDGETSIDQTRLKAVWVFNKCHIDAVNVDKVDRPNDKAEDATFIIGRADTNSVMSKRFSSYEDAKRVLIEIHKNNPTAEFMILKVVAKIKTTTVTTSSIIEY